MLRIGINLGDVIIDGDDIYGDGVNIAARLEPLAEPGGICVSSIVNESVGNRIDVRFQDGGEVTVKNIDRPIRVWKWHPGATPDRRQIRRLPNVAQRRDGVDRGSAIHQHVGRSGAGIFLRRHHRRHHHRSVEDRGPDGDRAQFELRLQGALVDIRTVGRELGVRSVLEGSIRRAGNRVRITAQLIDAATGGHLWADRYDRELTDIFEVQDEVTRQIVDALKVTLSPAEKARLTDTETTRHRRRTIVFFAAASSCSGSTRTAKHSNSRQRTSYGRSSSIPTMHKPTRASVLRTRWTTKTVGPTIQMARFRLPNITRNRR